MKTKKSYEDIYDGAKEKAAEDIGDFCRKVRDGTSDPKSFMTIFDLEKLWSQHKASTSQIYSDTLSDILSSIDQKELIKSKKANIEGRG